MKMSIGPMKYIKKKPVLNKFWQYQGNCLNLLNHSLEGLSSWKNKLIKDYQKHDILRLPLLPTLCFEEVFYADIS